MLLVSCHRAKKDTLVFFGVRSFVGPVGYVLDPWISNHINLDTVLSLPLGHVEGNMLALNRHTTSMP